MFVEQLLDYSYEHECIWASATLYSVPQEICSEYVRGSCNGEIRWNGRKRVCPRLRAKSNITC